MLNLKCDFKLLSDFQASVNFFLTITQGAPPKSPRASKTPGTPDILEACKKSLLPRQPVGKDGPDGRNTLRKTCSFH